ncbi:LMBR1-like membrane protein-domain-containing protein [Syncephalis plumigaleata]|nr:LMBR1-like membrane protein-domain-containing protein [Syncephalis plumigaleata]
MGLGAVQLVDYILPILLVLAPCFTVAGAVWRYAWEVRLPLLPGTIAAMSWFVGFAVVALLPLDLTSTIYRRCSKQLEVDSSECHRPAVYISESTLLGLWRSMYWTTFFLNWIMIPVLQGYLQSGQFLFRRRLRNAIKGHAIYFGGYAILAMVAIVYILSTNHFATWHAFLAFVMAAANCWGLLLVLMFMGHGLVAVPRTLWRAANTKRRWIQVTRRAVNIKDAYEEAEAELVDVVATIAKLDDTLETDHEYRWMVDILIRKCPISMVGSYQRVSIPRVITEKYITLLHRRYKKAQRIYDRALWQVLHTSNEGFGLQDELENRDNPDREYHTTLEPLSASSHASLRRSMRWWWYIILRPFLLRLLAIVCGLLSITLLWSELTLQWENPMLSLYGLVLRWANRSYGLTEFVSILSLAYMCVCAYSSLLRIRIFNLYALVPRRSDRPLCYNYLNLVVAQDDAVFSKFMGILDLVPFLGDRFNQWTPLLILVPSLLTFFRISDRITRVFGCGDYSYDDDDDYAATSPNVPLDGLSAANGGRNAESSNRWRKEESEEGRRLIQAERREVIRAMGIDPRGHLTDQRVDRTDRVHRGYNDIDNEASRVNRQHDNENALRLWIPANGPDQTISRVRAAAAANGNSGNQWTQKITSAVGSIWQRARPTPTNQQQARYERLQGITADDDISMPSTPNDERTDINGRGERIRMQPSTRPQNISHGNATSYGRSIPVEGAIGSHSSIGLARSIGGGGRSFGNRN